MSKREKYIRWNKEKKEYLIEIYKGKKYKQIAELMTEKFKEEYTENKVSGMLRELKLQTGTTNKFKKGNIPWHKGRGNKKIKGKGKGRGRIPKPIGTESINNAGYIIVKVGEKEWQFKHRLLYEKYNGKIPKDYIVIFGDKDKRNFNPDNLILISKKQQMTLNKYSLVKEDIELTKTGINLANLILKIREREKNE